MEEDSRLTTARNALQDAESKRDWSPLHNALSDLLDYAESRLRINVGLIAENSALRAKVGTPPTPDLSTIPSADLLAELAHRLEDGP